MEISDIFTWLVPALTGIAGWLTGRRKQNNDFLSEMQNSINLLSSENARLLEENLQLKKELVELKVLVYSLKKRGI
jgi:hypothetical protein